MRLLLAAIFFFLLAGCATTPIEGSARAPRDSGTFAVGTLAPWGSFEHEAAPGYTRLAVARRLAARRLDDGRLSVEQARAVQAAADEARKALDAARNRADLGDRTGARRELGKALERVSVVESMVRGVQ